MDELYDDLIDAVDDHADQQQSAGLHEQMDELRAKLAGVIHERDELAAAKSTLLRNISCLYKTAVAELERKNATIKELHVRLAGGGSLPAAHGAALPPPPRHPTGSAAPAVQPAHTGRGAHSAPDHSPRPDHAVHDAAQQQCHAGDQPAAWPVATDGDSPFESKAHNGRPGAQPHQTGRPGDPTNSREHGVHPNNGASFGTAAGPGYQDQYGHASGGRSPDNGTSLRDQQQVPLQPQGPDKGRREGLESNGRCSREDRRRNERHHGGGDDGGRSSRGDRRGDRQPDRWQHGKDARSTRSRSPGAGWQGESSSQRRVDQPLRHDRHVHRSRSRSPLRRRY